LIVNYETNLLSLVRPWLDNNCQIQIKVLQCQILIPNPNLNNAQVEVRILHKRCVRKVNVLGKKIKSKKIISASVKALIYMKRSRSACSNMHVFKRVRQLLVRLVHHTVQQYLYLFKYLFILKEKTSYIRVF